MSLTTTLFTSKHNGDKHPSPQCHYNQPLQASWLSLEDDDDESSSSSNGAKDNAVTIGRYEALLDDEAISKSYLDPTPPPPLPAVPGRISSSSKLSQIRNRIRTKKPLAKDTARSTALPPPRSPVPVCVVPSSSTTSSCSSSCSFTHHQRTPPPPPPSSQQPTPPLMQSCASTSTCSSSSASSDPLFSLAGESSTGSESDLSSPMLPTPSTSSSSRLKLAFQKLRRRHYHHAVDKAPAGSCCSSSSSSTAAPSPQPASNSSSSSAWEPTPSKSTSFADRIRNKLHKRASSKSSSVRSNSNRVLRSASLTSVATWSHPEQQQHRRSGDTPTVSQQQQQQTVAVKRAGTMTTPRPQDEQRPPSQQLLLQEQQYKHRPHHHHHHHHHYHRSPPPPPAPAPVQYHHHHHHHQNQRQQQRMQLAASLSSPPPPKGLSRGVQPPRASMDHLLSSSTSQQHQHRPASMPLGSSETSTVRFARVVSVKETFSRYEYDRGSDPDAVCTRLTPAMAQYIKQELNMYKLHEMPVHEQSRIHTHFFL